MFCCVVNEIGFVVRCVEDAVGIDVSLKSLGFATVVGLSLISPFIISEFELVLVVAGVDVLSSSGI